MSFDPLGLDAWQGSAPPRKFVQISVEPGVRIWALDNEGVIWFQPCDVPNYLGWHRIAPPEGGE